MSTSAEGDNQLDAVTALRDVMDHICKYLSRKDLCNLADVCKSWREDSLRERARRNYIQQLRLFYKFGNLDSKLQVEPHLSILVYDSKLEKELPPDKLPRLKKKILKHFEKKQPHKAVVLKVKECLTTEEVDSESTMDQGELKVTRNIHCGILGLFLPSNSRRLRVRVAWKPSVRLVDYAAFVAECFADKLHLDDEKRTNFKSTLLVFVKPHQPGASVVAEQLGDRLNKDKETLWIGEMGAEIVAAEFRNKNHRQNKKKCIAAIKISGPTLESWSKRVDLRQPRAQVERQLHELMERVTLKRHCTALLSAPSESKYGSSRDIMRVVKRIFPGIPFVGLFDSHKLSIRVSATEDMLFIFENYSYMSLVIVTYD